MQCKDFKGGGGGYVGTILVFRCYVITITIANALITIITVTGTLSFTKLSTFRLYIGCRVLSGELARDYQTCIRLLGE